MTAGKRKKSSRVVAGQLRKQRNIPSVSYRTVQRYWHDERLYPYKQRKVSRLKEVHKLQRRSFVRAHRKTNWDSVLFVDEKFSRYANINNKNDVVWAYSPDAVPPYEVLQHGPELMVWGGMCSRGVTPLYRITGTLRSPEYTHILNNVALPAVSTLLLRKHL